MFIRYIVYSFKMIRSSSIPKKKPKATKETKPRCRKSHPPITLMVHTAIKNMKERGGSSLKAIKKYMASIYKINSEKLSTLIKKAIKNGVASGTLIQTKGTGANGSFKIANNTKKKIKTVKKTEKPKNKTPKKKSGKSSRKKPEQKITKIKIVKKKK